MAKKSGASTLKQYNSTIKAIRQSTGVSRKEAQQAYRASKVILGHSPTKADVKSKAVQESAQRAGAQLRAQQRAKERYVRESIERAKAPRPKRGAEPPPGPARPRGGRRGGEGGEPGGGGPVGRGREPAYDFGDFYDEIPDDMYGDEDDSPGGE